MPKAKIPKPPPESGKRTVPIRVARPLPCPCCGEDRPAGYDEAAKRFFGLRVGQAAADASGVRCASCGLTLVLPHPDEWPPGVFLHGQPAPENLRRIEQWTTAKAVKAWNRRSHSPSGRPSQ